MSEIVETCQREIAFLHAQKATLVNFTGSSYHWGCFGTSMEIYHTLLEKGYYVEIIDVNTTHRITPTPEEVSDFDDLKFFQNYIQNNNRLLNSLSQSDLIVVNGEGTLHRLSKGALNLLYLMYICKKHLDKNVQLINFSCFPNGDRTLPHGIHKIYPNVLKYIDNVKPRDYVTNDILVKSGIETVQAFDCLPRFLKRYNLTNSHVPKGYILVSGGVSFNEKRYELLLEFIQHFLSRNVPVKFLSGAHFTPASEDLRLQDKLKTDLEGDKFDILQARTMMEWVQTFQNASFLFSARFHHTIAALAIGTPFNYQSSNTPKITAILETLGETYHEISTNADGKDLLLASAEDALSRNSTIQSVDRVNSMTSLARNNFTEI
jgi:polysaccharide pyruvyl transferase WcaK-like protein